MICDYKPDNLIGPLLSDGRFFGHMPPCVFESMLWALLAIAGVMLLAKLIKRNPPNEL